MMDIVERLKKMAGKGDYYDDEYRAAIAEIERLRGIINDDRLEGAGDEIERLRQKHKEMVFKLKYVVNEYNGLLEEHNQLLAKALGEKK